MLDKLWKRVGRRGATLLLLSMVDLTLGYSMLTIPPDIAARAYLGHQFMFPLKYWGYLWLAAAMVLAFNAFRRGDRMGFGVAMGIKVLWAFGFWVSFYMFDISRAIVGACLWVVIAGWLYLVAGWPEAVKDHHVPE